MPLPLTQGFLITLEGGEGAGKTTQQAILANTLQQNGIECLCTREPGGTSLGQTLRDLLLHPVDDAISPLSELLLYAADRAEHVAKVIGPALAQGKVVICDRFIDSTVAYQGYGRGLDLQIIHQLNQIATQGLVPHLTFWLDLPVELGLARAKQRSSSDRMEQAEKAFHQRIYQGFQELALQNPHRLQRVAATGAVDQIAQQIWQLVQHHLPVLRS